MTPSTDRGDSASTEALVGRVRALTRPQRLLTARFFDSIEHLPRVQPVTVGWLSHDDWLEHFTLELASHHGTTSAPLKLRPFEDAFINACRSAGWAVSPASRTERFVDCVVTTPDGTSRKISLKSTAAKSLKEDSLHVSKLTEAAWLQDMRSAKDRRQHTIDLLVAYVDAVDVVIQLRAFDVSATTAPARYQLVEFPAKWLKTVERTIIVDFDSDGPTVGLPPDVSPPHLRLKLDRSDAKFTLKDIRIDSCTVHAEWFLEPTD